MEPTLRHVKWPVGPGGYTPHRASQPLVRFIWEDVGTGHKTADNKREAHPLIFNNLHNLINLN